MVFGLYLFLGFCGTWLGMLRASSTALVVSMSGLVVLHNLGADVSDLFALCACYCVPVLGLLFNLLLFICCLQCFAGMFCCMCFV